MATMNTTVIGIRGTFDIARGRNLLRTMIMARHFKPAFNARASATLTALGELILLTNTSRLVPVKINVLEESRAIGVEFSCDLTTYFEPDRLGTARQRLERATSDVEIEETNRGTRITVRVWEN